MTNKTNLYRLSIEGEEVKSANPIPVQYFNKRNNRSTKLINNENEGNFLKGRNARFEFSFSEPIYISSIQVKTKGYPSYKSLEFSWMSIHSSKETEKQKKFYEDKASIFIREIVTGFSIKPPKQYISNPQIESVIVWGLTLSEFDECCEIAGKLQKHKEKILEQCDAELSKATEAALRLANTTQKKDEIDERIYELTNEKTDLQTQVDTTKEKLEEASISYSEKKSQESDVISRIETLEDSIDQKKKEAQSLNTEISTSQDSLKKLRSDINIFPSEFQGFVTQGGRNILWYSGIALIPILLLVWYTLVLFSGAIDLTTIYQRQESWDL